MPTSAAFSSTLSHKCEEVSSHHTFTHFAFPHTQASLPTHQVSRSNSLKNCSNVHLHRIDSNSFLCGFEQNFPSSRSQAPEASKCQSCLKFDVINTTATKRTSIDGLTSQAAPERDAAGDGVLSGCCCHGPVCICRHDVEAERSFRKEYQPYQDQIRN